MHTSRILNVACICIVSKKTNLSEVSHQDQLYYHRFV